MNMRGLLIIVTSMLTLNVALTPVVIAGEKGIPGHGDGNSSRAKVDRQVETGFTRGFGDQERETIIEYFRSSQQTARPLPPGIAKNFARGKPLPPGIAKRYLPGELDRMLPVREGYERIIVGRDVVLVEIATRLIVDIIADVFG